MNEEYDPYHASAEEVSRWFSYARIWEIPLADRLAIARCVGLYGEQPRGMTAEVADGPLRLIWERYRAAQGGYPK